MDKLLQSCIKYGVDCYIPNTRRVFLVRSSTIMDMIHHLRQQDVVTLSLHANLHQLVYDNEHITMYVVEARCAPFLYFKHAHATLYMEILNGLFSSGIELKDGILSLYSTSEFKENIELTRQPCEIIDFLQLPHVLFDGVTSIDETKAREHCSGSPFFNGAIVTRMYTMNYFNPTPRSTPISIHEVYEITRLPTPFAVHVHKQMKHYKRPASVQRLHRDVQQLAYRMLNY